MSRSTAERDPLAVLIERIDDIESRLGIVSKNHEQLSAAFSRCQKHQNVLTQRLNKIEPHKVEKQLDQIAPRVDELAKRLQAMIIRVTVCTEIAYAARILEPTRTNGICAALIDLLDRPDEYWRSKEHRTIGDWLKDVAPVQ